MNGLSWSAPYIGLPYLEFGRDRAGIDCWGAVRLIYAEQLGIELPSYVEGYTSVAEHNELEGLISGAAGSGRWQVMDQPEPFDVLVFRRGHLRTHIGLVVTDRMMLHASRGSHSKIEAFKSGPWAHRLAGIYRHASRAKL